jgi:hypothetical protein
LGDVFEVFENDIVANLILIDGVCDLDELTILDNLFSLMPSCIQNKPS